MVLKNSCAALSNPTSLFIHPVSGNIYFSDSNTRTIHMYCPITSEVIQLFQFKSPSCDPKSIYVSNDEQYLYYTQCNTIRKLDFRSGKSTTIAGVEQSVGFNGDGKPGKETALYDPNSLRVFEEENEVYFLDICNHRVRKITNTGTVETIADLSEYPTFRKESTQINSCYGRMDILPSKKILYVSNDSFCLYKINLETKQAELITNFHSLNEWSLYNDTIYVCDYGVIKKIKNGSVVKCFKTEGRFKDLKVVSNEMAYAFVDTDKCINGSIIGLKDGKIHSNFITYSTTKRSASKQREFVFGSGGAFNIPKHLRDTKESGIMYFEPLMRKVAPIFFNQIQEKTIHDQAEMYQYLVDYCIYHHYNDFKAIDTELMKGLQQYFSNNLSDPVFLPLIHYIEEMTGVQKTKGNETLNNTMQKIGNCKSNFIKEHLCELFNDKDTSDYTIHIKERVLMCHKTILSKSTFFKTLLDSFTQFADTKENSFRVDEETNPKVMEIIVKYCYDIEPNIDEITANEFIELIEMCKLHELESLESHCTDSLNVSLEVFDPLCKFVQDIEEFHSLRSKLIHFAMNNTHDIIENIYCGKLFELSPFILNCIMKELPKWAQHQIMKLKQ